MVKLIITENRKPCAVLFVFFISEFAIVKVEVLAHVRLEDHREVVPVPHPLTPRIQPQDHSVEVVDSKVAL